MSGYVYANAKNSHAHAYLMPNVRAFLCEALPSGGSVFDLGCGNGSVAADLTKSGYSVTGVDPSSQGIEQARMTYPSLDLHPGSSADDLAATFGRFPVVISLEVVEHVYDPHEFARRAFGLLEPGGTLILSTPYHGYLKNLALAVSGKMDSHFTALWPGGHIKFWSEATMRTLLSGVGFTDIRCYRVGRLPPLAKSMIVTAMRSA
jgi:2-polyprenyl-3-methyl-5-hydroxy-6-metoxy-1,4-benzoquinol methylase